MKKRRLTAAAAATACLLTLTLAGCGGTNDVKSASEPLAISQAFGQESVWIQYRDDQIGKDTGVERVDLDGMSNDEIIDLAKQKDRERFDATKQSAIDETNEEIENPVRTEYGANVAAGQKVNEAAEYQEPEAVPFTLRLETDDTGNIAASETLSFEHQSLNISHFYSGSHIGSHPDRYADEALYETEQVDIDLSAPIYSTTSIVYDTTFGGFQGLATIVNEDHAGFMLDTPDTEGIEVD